MSPIESIAGALAALVHPDKRSDPVQFLRHRIFIGCRLALSASAVLIAPVALALRGAPTVAEAVAFGWMMFPMASALYVARTGDITRGQAIHVIGLIGLSLTLAISGAAAAAALWLILVPVEAAFSRKRATILAAGLAACASALMLTLAPFSAAPSASVSQIAAFVIPAIMYVMFATLSGRVLQQASHRMAVAGDARYRLLAETIGDLVMRHDRGGAVLFASNGGNDVFRFTSRDVAGRGFFERVHVADRPAYLSAVAEAAQGGAMNVTLRVNTGVTPGAQSAFGEPAFSWAELRCRHANKEVEFDDGAAVVSVLRDVNAAKLHEDELVRMRAEAERANLWKDRFLANVSHELRTPLNAIIGFSEMLRDPSLAPRDAGKQREYAGIIRDSGEHLLAMVNSLLDMSKIEAGRFEIAPEPFAVRPLVESVADMMRLKAEQGGVRFEASLEPGVGEIIADKRACKQILINLVSNAVKFTPDGGAVTLRVRPEGNSLAIDVIDTGVGIPALDLPRLGDAFFQARAAYDRPHEGTGLGLSLVRGLVGLHGGAIAIESAPGAGTHVCVRLPLDCRIAQLETAPARIETIARRGAAERPGAASSLEPAKRIA